MCVPLDKVCHNNGSSCRDVTVGIDFHHEKIAVVNEIKIMWYTFTFLSFYFVQEILTT